MSRTNKESARIRQAEIFALLLSEFIKQNQTVQQTTCLFAERLLANDGREDSLALANSIFNNLGIDEDFHLVITVTRRSDDFHACFAGHSEIWACGQNSSEAVGELIRIHSDFCGILFDYDCYKPAVGVAFAASNLERI